jgi:DNA invertase Pin-like site-specific DNA recombinase
MDHNELLQAVIHELRDATPAAARKFRQELHQAELDARFPLDHRRIHNFDTNVQQTGGVKYGYALISPLDSDPTIQLDALKKDGCKRIFKDEGIRVTSRNRPELVTCLETLKRGDTLTVWSLDRIARSVRDLVNIGRDFRKCGIIFCSLSENIDTSQPADKFAFQHFAAVAEFERRIMIERANEGRYDRKQAGVRTGPPLSLSPEQLEHARDLIAQGYKKGYVAKLLDVSRGSLWRYLKNDTPRPRAVRQNGRPLAKTYPPNTINEAPH